MGEILTRVRTKKKQKKNEFLLGISFITMKKRIALLRKLLKRNLKCLLYQTTTLKEKKKIFFTTKCSQM